MDHEELHASLINSNNKQTFSTYYSKIDESYGQKTESLYHKSRVKNFSVIIEKHLNIITHEPIIDFGCGDGLFSAILADIGSPVICIDPSETLVNKAKIRMKDKNGVSYIVNDAKALVDLEDNSCAALTAFDVLDYLEEEEEQFFYKQAHRILRDGGKIISSHSNELFDMYTFNRYTVGFFKNHFGVDISSLITNPDIPLRSEANIRGNPLTHRHKVARYGFREIDQSFLMLHQQPPLLDPAHNPDDLNGRTFPETHNWPAEEAWKLMFMCSVFCSVSEK